MKLAQTQWHPDGGWVSTPNCLNDEAQLVLMFGSSNAMANHELIEELRKAYPNAHMFGCSTAGEICGTQVSDDSLVATAIQFESTEIMGAYVKVTSAADSIKAGRELGAALNRDGLRHVLVLSDGINVNGSELVAGVTENLPPDVTVTGGLSADSDRFKETRVIWDGMPEQNAIAAVGLYGDRVHIGYGSLGGWDPFGPERVITRSEGNVLYELDGKSALELYKQYLGEHASGLPSTGLLFPLSVRANGDETAVVRTILAVDESERSLTFAGDVKQGSYARLMRANFNRLISGAAGAAKTSRVAMPDRQPDLAVLISCVGRKLVLKQRIEEEVESVRDVLGADTVLTGFYSYGEISPFTRNAKCELHNQTMTITTLSES